MEYLSSASSRRWLQRIGVSGTALALAILGASMLLRLSTEFGPDGQAQSALPPALEQATRLLHRLSASGVSLLALGAIFLCWRLRKLLVAPVRPTAWLVAAIGLLAVIGPLTPGYRMVAITVLNVTVGIVLLMAFWWLRETAALEAGERGSVDVVARLALLAFIAHVALGAAASAYQMHGVHWPAWLHLGSFFVSFGASAMLLVKMRKAHASLRGGKALRVLMALQLLLGVVLLWLDPRPVWLNFVHAMLSPLLAMALVSLIQRNRLQSATPHA